MASLITPGHEAMMITTSTTNLGALEKMVHLAILRPQVVWRCVAPQGKMTRLDTYHLDMNRPL